MTKNLLDVITADRELPEGYDFWAIRSVRPDFRSRNGFRWPFPGQVAEAPGPIHDENETGCPRDVGDGICAALTWDAMASGGLPAATLLLVAVAESDVLGREFGDSEKFRARRMLVADVVDGARLVRESGVEADLRGANLGGANLKGANLKGANLKGANLKGADLRGATLEGADLWGADLRGATLEGADLWGANLKGANLKGADLRGATLEGADLRGATLEGADLRGADLERANLKGANLKGANLKGADLRGATLEGADLWGATLERANLKGAQVSPIFVAPDGWRVGNGIVRRA